VTSLQDHNSVINQNGEKPREGCGGVAGVDDVKGCVWEKGW
jgi:hypothetical protein